MVPMMAIIFMVAMRLFVVMRLTMAKLRVHRVTDQRTIALVVIGSSPVGIMFPSVPFPRIQKVLPAIVPIEIVVPV
jgi:hypothetical protein